jgi:hypothetical protein
MPARTGERTEMIDRILETIGDILIKIVFLVVAWPFLYIILASSGGRF